MNKLTQTSEEEIQAVVDKCWQDIGNICGDETVKKSLSSPFDPRIRGWRVVRLFVSSTFADYHAEREVLVKKVVPELREWCEEKSINLIECDLRWGVPKDSTTETTIRTCLGEINRCAAEADGEPFFLNMLGERYGWIPDSSEISEEIQEEYQWIFPTSITHMEIIHAAYKMQNKNALFLLRDSEFLADLPPQMMKAFVDDHPLNKAHLKALKENLRQRYPGQVFDYSCQYGGIDESTGRSKVKLKGLEVFCQIVLEFFKSAINRLIPTVNQTLSVEEIELSMHNQFIELRGQLVLGRGEEITTVMNYVQHGTISDGSGSGRLPPLIVLGSSGSGKSALMAYCTLEIQNLGLPLFFHFVGACPGSTVPLKLLEKLVRWFNKGFSVEDIEQMSVKQLQQEIKEGVEELGKREEVFVIMIDAVNQKLDAEQMKLLIDSPGASNPLWLSLSCEELRVFGVFETITRHIVNLPSTLKELLKFIMNRLTAEDEDDNIQKVLGLLACSRGGLGETELQYLLSDDLSKAVAMMVWAQVRRTLKPFLRNVAGRREEERLDFFHASIQEVVLETILQDSEEKEKFHLKLADYFELHCKDKDRVIFMAPEQLKLAGKRKRLLEFLRNEERSGKPGQWKDRYYEDLRCDMRLLPGTAFSHNVHICRFCDMKRGAFGEHSCFICGRFTPWRNDMQAARVCHAHELPGPPNLVMCYLCRKPAFIDYAMVYLCALCENVAIKRCAMLVTD
ncbi:telomerase protein component 1-like isoform X2 [Pocillopora verrucosa]|uniref:telomerase protein component 1-like isoform X2 n=1 Tax=Pocillopora verrucosa TaxID=203993 RepID=UPI003341CF13